MASCTLLDSEIQEEFRDLRFSPKTPEEVAIAFEKTNTLMQLNNKDIYTVNGIDVGSRVSDKAKAKYNTYAEDKLKQKNTIIQMQGGTLIHHILEMAGTAYYNERVNGVEKETAYTNALLKSYEEFVDTYNKGSVIGFNTERGTEMFNLLLKTVVEVVDEVFEVQEKIDSTKKASIYFEQKIFDPRTRTGVGGTGDIIVVYSDMSGGYFDYKTYAPNYSELVNGLVTFHGTYGKERVQKWGLTVPEYRRILSTNYGIKAFRQSRIIPIATTWALTEEASNLMEIAFWGRPDVNEETRQVARDKLYDLQRKGLTYLPLLHRIQTNQGVINVFKEEVITEEESRIINDMLGQVIIGKETPIEENKRNLLEAIDKQIGVLNIKALKEQDDIKKSAIYSKISDLSRTKSDILLKNNVISSLHSLQVLIDDIDSLEEAAPDVIQSFIDDLSFYRSLFQLVHTFDLTKEELTNFSKLIRIVETRIPILKEKQLQYYNLTLDENKEIVFEDDSMLQKYSQGMGNSQNPFMQIGHRRLMEMQQRSKKNYETWKTNFDSVYSGLTNYGKQNGITKQEVFDLFINKSTGNLYGKVGKSIFEEITLNNKNFDWVYANYNVKSDYEERYKKAYANMLRRTFNELINTNKDTVMYLEYAASILGIETLDELFLTKNKDDISENFLKLLNFKIKTNDDKTTEETRRVSKIVNEFAKSFKAKVKNFEQVNRLFDSKGNPIKTAWTYQRNIKFYLEWKPEFENRHLTEEYKFIRNNSELNNFYNFWIQTIKEAKAVYGIYDNNELPQNFIPWVKKDLFDLVRSGNVKEGFEDTVSALKIDNESFFEEYDVDGNLIRTVPRMYLAPFKHLVNGELKPDTDKKSYNLAEVLNLFVKTTYDYKFKLEEEAHQMALKDLMMDYGALYQTNKFGKVLRDKKFGKTRTKEITKENEKIYEDYLNFYLYGNRIATKDVAFGNGYSLNKTLVAAKALHQRKTLAYNIFAPAGALGAGTLATWMTGKTGQVYTDKDWNFAIKELMKINNGDKNDFLNTFMPFQHDTTIEKIEELKDSKFLKKLLGDKWAFKAFQWTDDALAKIVSIAMSKNYVLDDNNKLRHVSNYKGESLYTAWKTYSPEQQEAAIRQFNAAVTEVMRSITGQIGDDNMMLLSTNVWLNLMSSYRTWLPHMVYGMVKDMSYNSHLDLVQTGIYTEVLATFNSQINTNGITKGITKSFIYYMLELLPFVNNNENQEFLKTQYELWQQNHPQRSKKNDGTAVSFEEFKNAKRAATKRFAVQLRVMALMLVLYMLASGDYDDDGEPDWKKTLLTRNAMRIYNRIWSETATMYSWNEFDRFVKGGQIPAWGLFNDVINLASNTVDETLDIVSLRKDKSDTKGLLFYTHTWFPIIKSAAKISELYPNYKLSDR